MKKSKLRKLKQHKDNVERIVNLFEELPGRTGIYNRIEELTPEELRQSLHHIARILGYRRPPIRSVREEPLMEQTGS